MPRRLLFRQDGLNGIPDAPSGYNYIGYVGATFSEKSSVSTTTIGSGGAGSTASTNLGNILYVSKNGNDSTAVKGDLLKPYSTILAAKNAAVSGDIIHVFAGTWTYDNRNSNGNPYNGQVNTLVNLWKDGITYYFEPGAKIIMYNQTVSGSDMYLFRPLGVSYETCTVLGYLEYEQNSTGADTSNGTNYYFYGTPIGTDVGYTFYSETAILRSNHCEVTRITRSSSTANVTRITIKSDYEEWSYLGGQSASGGFYRLEHLGTDKSEFTSHVRLRRFPSASTNGYPFYCSSNSNATINIYGDQISNLMNGNLFLLRNQSGVINCEVKVIYYTTAYTPFGYYGSIVSTNNSGGWIMNITGDLIDSAANSQTTGLFYLTTANNTLNFTGNIITNTTSGIGRFIAATTQPNTITINGDINLIGTGTSSQVLLQPNGSATINYSGKISGLYAGPLVKTFNGTMNINNSVITSTATSSTSLSLVENGATNLGICRINNSYVNFSNYTNQIISGNYVKVLVNNSTIINSGTASVALNNVTTGSLQLLNSAIISNPSATQSISYQSTSPVISQNTVTNATYSINTLSGSISVLNEIIY